MALAILPRLASWFSLGSNVDQPTFLTWGTQIEDSFGLVTTAVNASTTFTSNFLRPRVLLYGTNANQNLTLNAASTYKDACEILIQNGTARRWYVTIPGYSTISIWPGQTMRVSSANDGTNTVWQLHFSPIWVWFDGQHIIYVDSVAGNDANDGLVAGAGGALKTIGAAQAMLEKFIDCFQNAPKIQLSTGTHVVTGNSFIGTKRIRGYHVAYVVGDDTAGSPNRSNYILQAKTDQYIAQFRDYTGMILNGCKLEAYNLNCSMTNGSATITATNHGFAVNDKVMLMSTGTLPSGFTESNINPYYVVSATTNTLTISASQGGGAITAGSTYTGQMSIWSWNVVGVGASQTGITDVQNLDYGNMPGGTHIELVNGGHAGYTGGATPVISGRLYKRHIYVAMDSGILITGVPSYTVAVANFVAFIESYGGAINIPQGFAFTGPGAGSGSTGVKISGSPGATLILGAGVAATIPGNTVAFEYVQPQAGGVGLLGQVSLPWYQLALSNNIEWGDNGAGLGLIRTVYTAGTITWTGATNGYNHDTFVTGRSATATPAAASAVPAFKIGSAGLGIYWGTGSPNTVVTAPKGSLYIQTDGSGTANRMWINTNGTTGWTNFTTAA